MDGTFKLLMKLCEKPSWYYTQVREPMSSVYSDIIGVHIVIYYVRTRNHYQIIIVGCTGAGSDKFITASSWLCSAVIGMVLSMPVEVTNWQ